MPGSRVGWSGCRCKFHSPGQVVIAGEKAAVERTIEIAKTKGMQKRSRSQSVCSVHTPLMAEGGGPVGPRIRWGVLGMTCTCPGE